MENYINKSYSLIHVSIEMRKLFSEKFSRFFENWIFAIFERPEGVGRSFNQKII